MGRTGRGSNDRFRPTPVKKIELEDKNNKKRLIIVIALIVIALGFFGYGTFSYFSSGDGWNEVQVMPSSKIAEQREFTFMYCLGQGEQSGLVENRILTQVYTDSMKELEQLFDAYTEYENVHNIYYINHHPNEVITVEPALYEAFSKIKEYDNRSLFLAPIYAEYNALFYCNTDYEASKVDPLISLEQKEYVDEVISYCTNPSMIYLELLDEHQIKLVVDPKYVAFQQEMGFDKWIDFAWMKNAFLVDGIADAILAKGYTMGVVSSYDGFVRNLDDSGNQYTFPIMDCVDQTVYYAANLNYQGGTALCWFRDFPKEDLDIQHYYSYENGEIRTLYLDPSDGVGKQAVHSMIAYQKGGSCVDIMLKMAPIYLKEEMDFGKISGLQKEAISVVFGDQYVLYYSDNSVEIDDLYDLEGIQYQKELLK